MTNIQRSLVAMAVVILCAQGPSRLANSEFTQLVFCTWWGGCGLQWFYTEQVNVVASYGELQVWGDNRWGYATCDGCFRMVDEPPPHPEPVEVVEEGPTPTSLYNYTEKYVSETPSWCAQSPPVHYYKVRDYQVLDQNGQYIQRTMAIDESLTTGTNTCGLSFIEGDTYTTSQGTFRDNFFMCGSVPACASGGSCSTVKNQTLKADNNAVGNYQITYTCSGVTITP